jgi:hypothetical protein
MNEPTWKLMPLQPTQTTQIVWREWPDGKLQSCLVTAFEYLEWLEAGNTPLPAEE